MPCITFLLDSDALEFPLWGQLLFLDRRKGGTTTLGPRRGSPSSKSTSCHQASKQASQRATALMVYTGNCSMWFSWRYSLEPFPEIVWVLPSFLPRQVKSSGKAHGREYTCDYTITIWWVWAIKQIISKSQRAKKRQWGHLPGNSSSMDLQKTLTHVFAYFPVRWA